MEEFNALYESLTKEGQVKLVNTIMSFASAEDIVDGMYKEAKEKEKQKINKSTVAGSLILANAGAVGGAALLHRGLKKKASDEIDEAFFKHAKMTIPTPEEAKKETKPKQQPDDRPDIKCESCDYEGKTDAQGRCPVCGAIMGVKPSDYPIPYTPIWTGEPMSGISVNEANTRGKMEEVW